jgi:hypothetical protein
LRDYVLIQAPSARADPVTKVANPTPIVLAHVEVVVIAELQARVAELSIALVLGFLAKLKVSAQIHVPVFFILVQLE